MIIECAMAEGFGCPGAFIQHPSWSPIETDLSAVGGTLKAFYLLLNKHHASVSEMFNL